jgi:hypothetical protein
MAKTAAGTAGSGVPARARASASLSDPSSRWSRERRSRRFEAGGEIVGYLKHFNPDLLTALLMAEALSGGVALERAGRLALEALHS